MIDDVSQPPSPASTRSIIGPRTRPSAEQAGPGTEGARSRNRRQAREDRVALLSGCRSRIEVAQRRLLTTAQVWCRLAVSTIFLQWHLPAHAQPALPPSANQPTPQDKPPPGDAPDLPPVPNPSSPEPTREEEETDLVLSVIDETQLQEIVVTAQKRRESLQEIPVSVRTLNGEEVSRLRASGVDIRFLSARIPSLVIESSFGRTFPRFYIRGLGNPDFDLNASQPVSMILDEVVLENPILRGFPIFDVERVEVLRGPQGTLFGRNTPAGIVKFESVRPSFDFEGHARTTYGSFGFVGMEAAVGGPLMADLLAARISVLYERRDDWVDNTFTQEEDLYAGFEDVTGRVQLLFTPGRLRALFNLHAHSHQGSMRLFRANIIEPGTDEFVDGFRRDEVAIDGQNRQEVNQLGLVANLEYDDGPVTITSISGYESLTNLQRGDIDGGFGASSAPPSGPGNISFPSETADGIPRLRQFTQKLRIASNDWKIFNFQIGGFYFHEELEIDSFSYDSLANGVRNGRAFQSQTTNAFAGFASVSVDIYDNLRVAGGVRLSHDRKDFFAERIESPVGAGPLAPQRANPKDTFLSWDASILVGITDGLNLYGRVARGFRAPSIQGRILFGDAISVADSESIISVEGGVKSEFFGRHLRLNLTGFYYDLSDQQLTAVGRATNFNTLLNSEQSIGFGFEADGQVILLSSLALSLGVSFNKTEIGDEDLAIVPCASGCTVRDDQGTVDGTVLIDGNSLPNAPEWIFNAIARYGLPVGSGGELFLYGDIAFRSRVHFFLYESSEFTDAFLFELGLRFGYTRLDGTFELTVFGRNLSDDTSRTGGIDFNNLAGFLNEPRTWGVEGRFRF